MAGPGLNRAAANHPNGDGHITMGTRCSLSIFGPGVEATPTTSVPLHKILLGGSVWLEHSGRTHSVDAFAVPAGVAHRVHAPKGVHGGVAFLDARRFRFSDVERLTQRFRAFVPGHDDPLELYADALKVPAPRLDARLEKAVGLLETGASVAEIARRVGLSESRLSHLFSERLGTPLRAWRNWLLLRWGMVDVYSGCGVTEAAHATGFADAAHLSRSCRKSLGVTPTLLSGYRTSFVTERLSVLECTALRKTYGDPRLVRGVIRKAYGF